MVTGLESTLQRSVAVEDGGGDELLAVTASLRVFHFANVPLAALEVYLSSNMFSCSKSWMSCTPEREQNCWPFFDLFFIFRFCFCFCLCSLVMTDASL